MSILTPQEYLEGKIPTPKDFRNLEAEIRGFYGENDTSISTMFVYGSFARGDYTPSSDVDLLIIYEYDETLSKAQELACDVKKKRGIDLEINIFQQELFSQNIHTLIPCFNQHLIKSTRDNFMNFGDMEQIRKLNSSKRTIRKSALKSLDHKVSTLGKKMMYNDDNSRSKLLKLLIQEPLHLMRLYIQTQNPTLFENEIDSKDNLRENFLKLILPEDDFDNYNSANNFTTYSQDEINLIEYLNKISKFKQEYLEILENRTKGITELAHYENFLDRVEEELTLSYLDFGREVLSKSKKRRFKFSFQSPKLDSYSPFSE